MHLHLGGEGRGKGGGKERGRPSTLFETLACPVFIYSEGYVLFIFSRSDIVASRNVQINIDAAIICIHRGLSGLLDIFKVALKV